MINPGYALSIAGILAVVLWKVLLNRQAAPQPVSVAACTGGIAAGIGADFSMEKNHA